MNKAEKLTWITFVVIILLIVFYAGVVVGITSILNLGKWAIQQLDIVALNETCVCARGLK